ncbi:Hemin uptake protein hemP [compost metagenome]
MTRPYPCATEVVPPDAGTADYSSAPPPAACSNAAEPCFTWQSTDLLQGNKRVHIAHNGGVYQLQATRQGKLILTK